MLFATHYHPLNTETAADPHIQQGHMAALVGAQRDTGAAAAVASGGTGRGPGSGGDGITFLYQLRQGPCDKSYGLLVSGVLAELEGLGFVQGSRHALQPAGMARCWYSTPASATSVRACKVGVLRTQAVCMMMVCLTADRWLGWRASQRRCAAGQQRRACTSKPSCRPHSMVPAAQQRTQTAGRQMLPRMAHMLLGTQPVPRCLHGRQPWRSGWRRCLSSLPAVAASQRCKRCGGSPRPWCPQWHEHLGWRCANKCARTV